MENEDFDLFDYLMRFEKMLQENRPQYFDADEILELIKFLNTFDPDKSEKAMDYALKLHPNSTELLLQKIQLLLDKEELKKAYSLLKKIESTEQSNYQLWKAWAIYHIKRGNVAKALAHAEKGERLCSGYDKVDFYLDLADEFALCKYSKEAEQYYHKALAIDPQEDYPRFKLARLYIQDKEYQRALDIYNEFISKDPFDIDAWLNKGKLHEELEEYDEAINAFEFAYSIDPEDEEAVTNLAWGYFDTLRYNKAIQIIQDFLQHFPASSEIHLILSLCHYFLKDFETAKSYAFNVLADDAYELMADAQKEKNATVWALLCKCFLFSKEIYMAEAAIEKVMEYDKSRSQYWYLLAVIQYLTNHPRKAKSTLAEGLLFEAPEIPETLELLENIYSTFDEKTALKLIEFYSIILENKYLMTQMSFVHLFKAMIYHNLRQPSKTIEELDLAFIVAKHDTESPIKYLVKINPGFLKNNPIRTLIEERLNNENDLV